MTVIPKNLIDLIDVDFPRATKKDSIAKPGRVNDKPITMGQYVKSQALELATPLPPTTFIERIYYAGKRAVISCTPERYFFNKRYAA